MKKKFTLLVIGILSLTIGQIYPQVGINTDDPKATLHVNGDLIIEDAPVQNNTSVLVINDEGKVGKAAAIPTKLLFAQSTSVQIFSEAETNNINNAQPTLINWENGDIVANNLVDFIQTTHSFRFKESALCEISGFINYNTNCAIPENYTSNPSYFSIFINVTIQYKEKNSLNWTDFGGARAGWNGTNTGSYYHTINIPAAIRIFNEGDEIRLVITRPLNLGMPHGKSDGKPSIGRPTGSQFTKGLKITVL